MALRSTLRCQSIKGANGVHRLYRSGEQFRIDMRTIQGCNLIAPRSRREAYSPQGTFAGINLWCNKIAPYIEHLNVTAASASPRAFSAITCNTLFSRFTLLASFALIENDLSAPTFTIA